MSTSKNRHNVVLYPEDLARADRIAKTFGLEGRSAAIRKALEIVEASPECELLSEPVLTNSEDDS